jgi:hypothetical protein
MHNFNTGFLSYQQEYRVHENSKDHLAAVLKAVDKLEENIVSIHKLFKSSLCLEFQIFQLLKF